jgi:hypothetical protein
VTTDNQQIIDQWLEYLSDAWQGLPRAAEEIDGWDLIEQIDYVEEWTPKVDLATQLRRLIAAPQATDEQRARYRRLERLMRENRPILDRLRAS